MPQETYQEILNRYQKLPVTLQNAMFNPAVGQNIAEITQRYNIRQNAPDVADAVADVFLGILHPNLFIKTLAEKTGMPTSQAKLFGMEITEKVFAPVKRELLNMYALRPNPLENKPDQPENANTQKQPEPRPAPQQPTMDQTKYGGQPPQQALSGNTVNLRNNDAG